MTLAELESLARAATPGPWTVDHSDSWFVSARQHPNFGICMLDGLLERRPANAAYIAALSPERVLALLAVVKAAEAMRERCRYEVAGQLHGAACAFDAALAELEQQT